MSIISLCVCQANFTNPVYLFMENICPRPIGLCVDSILIYDYFSLTLIFPELNKKSDLMCRIKMRRN